MRSTRVADGAGFMAMFGGALFVFVFLLLGVLAGEDAGAGVAYAAGGAALMPLLLLVPGAVGLFYYHADSFGWPGRLGTVAFVGGLGLILLDALWQYATGSDLVGSSRLVSMGILAAFAGGALLLGAGVVRAAELPHSRVGGLLLGLGLPLGLGIVLLVNSVLNLDVPSIAVTMLWVGPFGAAWVLLGFDLITEGSRLRASATLPDD